MLEGLINYLKLYILLKRNVFNLNKVNYKPTKSEKKKMIVFT